jgi:hypothetical protein
MLRPPASEQVQSIVRLNHALKAKGRLGSFPISNLGNVAVSDSESPFRVKDLRLFLHSFRTRAYGLVTHTINGEMRFYFMSNEKCVSRSQLDILKREFANLLQQQAMQPDEGAAEVPRVLGAIAG